MKLTKITQKDILFLSGSMFAVVVAWIAFSLYHVYVTTTISEDLQMQITPIDGTFDTDTINLLKSRTEILPIFEGDQTPQASGPAAPSPTPQEIEITPTEEPTGETVITTPTEEPLPSEEPTITP